MKQVVTIHDNANAIDRYTIGIRLESGDSYYSLLFKAEREINYPKGTEVEFHDLAGHVKLDILRFIKVLSE